MKLRMKILFSKFKHKELDAVGVIEVILILVIIIGLVLIFRNQIGAIIQEAFSSINTDAGGIGETIEIN
jgi:Flp pilus assembly pilin Flp